MLIKEAVTHVLHDYKGHRGYDVENGHAGFGASINRPRIDLGRHPTTEEKKLVFFKYS